MRKFSGIFFLCILLAQLIPNAVFGEKNKSDTRSELAVFLGGTTNKDGNAVTFGADYQYRLTSVTGIGVLVDHAAGVMKSTVFGAALWLHLKQWQLTLAPGIEFADIETKAVFRVGLEYEFELPPNFSISPAVNLDTERRGEPSVVYGLSFGMEL
jgi:hypothetical protein